MESMRHETHGGKPFPKRTNADGRNIIDHYWYWKNEAIKADLDKKRHPFSILLSNLYNDFNVACVVRANNAFLGEKIYFYGAKRYDKRGTVGTHVYENIKHLPADYEAPPEERVKALDLEELKEYTLVAFDLVEGAEPLDTFDWASLPKKPLMCFGQEQVGLPEEVLARCERKVYIRQFGSVRSMNIACCAAIAMYDFTTKVKGNPWEKKPE